MADSMRYKYHLNCTGTWAPKSAKILGFQYLGNAKQKMTTVVDCFFVLAFLGDVSDATVSF